MAHAMGGGFSGGGGHGGGGFHGGTGGIHGSSQGGYGYRRRPYPGALCYAYFWRGTPHYFYSDSGIDRERNTCIGTLIMTVIFLTSGLIFLFQTLQVPGSIPTTYDTKSYYEDNAKVLNADETASLKEGFATLFDKCGVSASFISTTNSAWNKTYNTIDTYALKEYQARFSDEDHWLYVCSIDDGSLAGLFSAEWEITAICGDSLSPVFTPRIEEKFKTRLDSLWSDRVKANVATTSLYSYVLDEATHVHFDTTDFRFYGGTVLTLIGTGTLVWLGFAFAHYLQFRHASPTDGTTTPVL